MATTTAKRRLPSRRPQPEDDHRQEDRSQEDHGSEDCCERNCCGQKTTTVKSPTRATKPVRKPVAAKNVRVHQRPRWLDAEASSNPQG